MPVYGRQETVAAPRQGFDESWIVGGIAQSVPEALYGGVQAMVKVDERVGRPESLLEFIAAHDLPGAFEKHGEELEGLLLELHFDAVAAQLSGARIDLVDAEFYKPVGFPPGHAAHLPYPTLPWVVFLHSGPENQSYHHL